MHSEPFKIKAWSFFWTFFSPRVWRPIENGSHQLGTTGLYNPPAAHGERFVPGKGPVSAAVWTWFGSPGTNPVCSKVIAGNDSSTTNLFQHLRQRHPAQGEKCGSLPDAKDRHRAQTPATKQGTLVGSSFKHIVVGRHYIPRLLVTSVRLACRFKVWSSIIISAVKIESRDKRSQK